MLPEELARMAKAIYGHKWPSKLGAIVKRDRRTVWRWGAGKTPVPDFVAEFVRLEYDSHKLDEITR